MALGTPAGGARAGDRIVTARVSTRRLVRHLSPFVSFVSFIALWQGVSAAHLVNPDFLPSALAVATAMVRLLRAHEIFANLGVTVITCLIGLALGALIGIPMGAAMAISPRVNGFFSPLIKATYSLPKTALVPLLMLWFGIGGATNITVVVLAALLPLVVYTYHGVHGVPRVLVWSALAMGTPRRNLIWRVLLPAAQQEIMIGLRIALGFSFVVGISAEMIASNQGIGKLLFIYGESGAYDYMFAATIFLLVVGYGADRSLVHLTNYHLRWQDSARHHE
jgi:ABC-type nitrate/sulfonate/bicarbonate transport system permease component